MSSTLRVTALSTEIPAADPARFIVGQDPEGHWVASEIYGRAGGLFRSCRAAVAYAEGETGRRPDAVLLSRECIALRL